jgi:hypothetical protein
VFMSSMSLPQNRSSNWFRNSKLTKNLRSKNGGTVKGVSKSFRTESIKEYTLTIGITC